MNSRGEDGWQICVAGEEPLNFLIYAACSYGLLGREEEIQHLWPDPVVRLEREELEAIRAQWQQLWDTFVRARSKPVGSPEYRHSFADFDPPAFERWAPPGLRDCLEQAWPEFSRWWNMPAGGRQAMRSWEEAPDFIRYVERFEREAGRWIKPIRLEVDLVYAGLSEPLLVSDRYWIMTPDRKHYANEEWWLKLFREKY